MIPTIGVSVSNKKTNNHHLERWWHYKRKNCRFQLPKTVNAGFCSGLWQQTIHILLSYPQWNYSKMISRNPSHPSCTSQSSPQCSPNGMWTYHDITSAKTGKKHWIKQLIWGNYSNSPTWILRPFGDDSPLLTRISRVRSQWGHDEIYPDWCLRAHDKWAIKNTPIPSHCTSWLIGFPTMGYHNPQ